MRLLGEASEPDTVPPVRLGAGRRDPPARRWQARA